MTTPPATSSGPAPTTLRMRTPEDLLAAVPVLLGFEPERSLVMLTFEGRHAFHARVDLPRTGDDREVVVSTLLRPALHHGVGTALFVVHLHPADDHRPARALGRLLRDRFTGSGIDVPEMILADGRRWWPLVGRRPGVPDHGVPYDVTAHPFRAQAVLDGRVTVSSREELAASVERDPERADRVAAAAARRPVTPTAAEAAALVERHVLDRTGPGDEALAGLLRGMQRVAVRDAVWLPMTRPTAEAHLAFWGDVVRRSPDSLAAPPASLLAFAAWLSGQGALAWCAVERASAADPAYRLAGLVAELLERAVPPSTWDVDRELALGDGL